MCCQLLEESQFVVFDLAGPFCQKVFRFLDPNGSGSISREETNSLETVSQHLFPAEGVD